MEFKKLTAGNARKAKVAATPNDIEAILSVTESRRANVSFSPASIYPSPVAKDGDALWLLLAAFASD